MLLHNWIFLAAIAGIASNLSNFCSRFVLKDGEDSAVYAWFFEFSRIVCFIVLALFDFHFQVSVKTVLLFILIGIVEIASILVYMKMHSYTHLSLSTIISRTRLIWIPILAFIFVGEHLKPQIYGGILIIFLGLSITASPKKLFFDKGILYAYASAFFVAITLVISKSIIPFISIPVLQLGVSVPPAIVIPFTIKNPRKRILDFFKENWKVKILGGFFNVVSVYIFLLALRAGPVSIVGAIYQSMMIVGVVGGIIFLNEREDIAKKIIGTLVALGGVLLLS